MDVGIVAIGRMKSGPERELLCRYLERAKKAGRHIGLAGFGVSEISESRNSSAAARKSDEAKSIRAHLRDGSVVVALDERGASISSIAFSTHISTWRDSGRGALRFIIGGADGLDGELVKKADRVLAFSALTWPHQLVRIMLAEQLYRTTTILSNHPYHREG